MNNCGTKFVSLSERLETETPAGRMIFTVLAAVSQLERELIAERVRNGLANARAKGKHIGRVKKRDSHMIRALLKKGLSYRAIYDLCSCSHGSVHAEKVAMKKEEELARLKAEEELKAIASVEESQVPTETAQEQKVIFVDLNQAPATTNSQAA